ncbi:MAG: DUF4159 domain-containing protein [Myxococcales bacterium]|nr:DUF4159 domain-containing protein [Myxococcales bacterium]
MATIRRTLSRRNFLGLSLAGWGLLRARLAKAIGPSSLLQLGQLELGQNWQPRPSALGRLIREVDKRTSIVVDLTPRSVRLADKDLHETPILYLAGDREFPMPSTEEVGKLRRFLTLGGFLIIDSAEGRSDGAFDGSVRQLVETLYPPPTEGLQLISKKHVIFKSFYLLEKPEGRLVISAALEGVMRDDRLSIAYIKNDMGGAWSRDDFGNWAFPCTPGGERQREYSFRMGINLIMYALCLDYKADQVHVDFIMRRRRWRPNDGAEIPE